MSRRLRPPAAPTRRARRLNPSCERLETLRLLSTASPVISGYVFADANNDGRPQAAETPVAGARVQLRTAAGAVVGTETTDAKGYYAFPTGGAVNPSAAAVQSVAQTLTLAPGYTNIDGAPFGQALQLFDPSLGTLVGVHVTSAATVSSTLQAENTSLSDTAEVHGSVTGTDSVDGLSRPLSGTASATMPVFHASVFDGTSDDAGTSGVTDQLAATDTETADLTAGADLAFYTATPGRTAVTPTATIHAALTAGATSGNTQYQAATLGSAVLTVTYDYLPNTGLAPGAYRVVAVPPSGFVAGKASSRTGQVVTPASGAPAVALTLTLTAAGSSRNDFGLLPVPGKPRGVAAAHVPTASKPKHAPAPHPIPVPSPRQKPVVHPQPAPAAAHPTGFLAVGMRNAFGRS